MVEWPTEGRESEVSAGLALVESGVSALYVGEAGVGKSRIVAEIAHRTSVSGRAVHSITGSPALRSIAFGAVAHLLGDVRAVDRALLVHELRDRLVADPGSPPLVTVDDVDLLDDASLAAVAALAAGSEAVVLATTRSDSASDPAVLALWKDQSLRRIDVGPLDRGGSDAVASGMLDGPISLALASRLWDTTRGNPLFLREVLLTARIDGAVVRGPHYWDLKGVIAASGRVQDLVQRRLADLDPKARRGLAAVAMADPIDAETLTAVASTDVLTTLEHQQLIEIDDQTGTAVVRMAHPLLGEVMREEVGRLDRHEILRAMAARLGSGDPSPVDALRVSTWLLDVGDTPPPELATLGALAAVDRFDSGAAERLGRAAIEAGETSTALAVLGRALTMQGRHDESVEVLERALDSAASDEQVAMAAGALTDTVLFGLGDPGRAASHLAAAQARVTDPAVRAELAARSLLVAGVAGDFGTALELGGTLVDADLPPFAAGPVLMAYTLALSMTGKVGGAIELLDRGDDLADVVRLQHPLLRDQLGLNRVLVLHSAARLNEGIELSEQVMISDGGSERLLSPWLYISTPARWLVGDLERAVVHTTEAVERQRGSDPIGTLVLSTAFCAGTHAILGHVARARELLDLASADPRRGEARNLVWLAQAEAWIAARSGQPSDGAGLVVEAGTQAAERWHVVWGAQALHTAVRFGYAEDAASELAALAARNSGPLVELLARHAAAAAAAEPLLLAKVAAEFVELGAWAAAADALAAEALAHDDSAAAARAALAAYEISGRCPAYDAPLLAACEHPLSDRQLAVARLAASGWSTRDIGRRLDVTPKTVENHLQRIYVMLGMNGRAELAPLMMGPPDRGS